MTIAQLAPVQIPSCQMPPVPVLPQRTAEETARLKERIRDLLRQENAVLVAHYYTEAALQELAEESGGCVADSLEMARFGMSHPASTLVVAGVRFMGETSKILNNEKRVLMPDPAATCSMDEHCPAELFVPFCDAHPDYTVVVYANTSAAVKARADWMVTSGIALAVVQHLAGQGKKILWAPDQHLGGYVQRESGADMLLWPGSCVVHTSFDAEALKRLKADHPEAAVLVHPESSKEVVALADVVGSTTAMIKAAERMPNPEFIVATEPGIFSKMRQLAPEKRFLSAPSVEQDGFCAWMKMNTLEKVVAVLESGANEIQVAPEVAARARLPIQRMLDFAATAH